MAGDRPNPMSTNVDDDLATWIRTTAAAENRTTSNMLWTLLEEARRGRTAQAAHQPNGQPAPIAGQTAIPVPGIRP